MMVFNNKPWPEPKPGLGRAWAFYQGPAYYCSKPKLHEAEPKPGLLSRAGPCTSLIIEHMWEYLDKRVRTRSPLPTNQDQMWTALQEEWANIDEDYIEKLYESMPNRVPVAALLKAKGSWTKY